MCDIFKRLCRLLQVRNLNTTAYHPESNGALERTHKTMTEYLRCFCNSRYNDGINGYILHVLCITLHHTQWRSIRPIK